MIDQHQVNTIIADAICSCRKDHPDQIDVEEAKHMAKCIVAALADAGLAINVIPPSATLPSR